MSNILYVDGFHILMAKMKPALENNNSEDVNLYIKLLLNTYTDQTLQKELRELKDKYRFYLKQGNSHIAGMWVKNHFGKTVRRFQELMTSENLLQLKKD